MNPSRNRTLEPPWPRSRSSAKSRQDPRGNGFDYLVYDPYPISSLNATYPSPSPPRSSQYSQYTLEAHSDVASTPTKEFDWTELGSISRSSQTSTFPSPAKLSPSIEGFQPFLAHQAASQPSIRGTRRRGLPSQRGGRMAARRAKPVGAPIPPGFTTDSHKNWIQESQILLPVDKTLPDSEWPIFTLRDVTIWRRDGQAYEDLLYVQNKGPFIVRGHLVVDHSDETQVKTLVKRNSRDTNVEVTAFRMSIGWSEEGPELWAASDYGFFLISHTTREYSSVFAKTSEAISLYYTIVFIYEEEMGKAKRKKKRNRRDATKLSVDELLLKYAVAIGDGITYEDAVEKCTQHAQFIAAHCPKEEQFDWGSTEFYKWIQGLAKKTRPLRSYPVPQTVQQAAPRGSSSAPSTAHSLALARRGRSSSTMEENEPGRSVTPREAASRRMKGARQPPAVQMHTTSAAPATAAVDQAQAQPSAPPKASLGLMTYCPAEISGDGIASTLYDTLVELLETPPSTIEKATLPGAGTKVYLGCRFREYLGAREMMEYYANYLVGRMEKDASRASAWKDSAIYTKLVEHATKPTATLVKITPALFAHSIERRRAKNPTVAQQPNEPEPKTEIQINSMEVDDPSDTSQIERHRGGRPSGKVAGLRLATTSSKKRPGSDLDDAGSSHRGAKGLKRARYFENGDEESDEESDTSNEIPSDGEPDQELTHLTIYAEPLPSKKPDFNGVWTCQEEDCGCVIYNADELEGQVAVEDHIYSHQDQIEAINLTRVEGRDTHRPYAHLLQKLIGIGAKKLEKKREEEGERPKPIKRALLD